MNSRAVCQAVTTNEQNSCGTTAKLGVWIFSFLAYQLLVSHPAWLVIRIVSDDNSPGCSCQKLSQDIGHMRHSSRTIPVVI